jgi:hypothetical protein
LCRRYNSNAPPVSLARLLFRMSYLFRRDKRDRSRLQHMMLLQCSVSPCSITEKIRLPSASPQGRPSSQKLRVCGEDAWKLVNRLMCRNHDKAVDPVPKPRQGCGSCAERIPVWGNVSMLGPAAIVNFFSEGASCGSFQNTAYCVVPVVVEPGTIMFQVDSFSVRAAVAVA